MGGNERLASPVRAQAFTSIALLLLLSVAVLLYALVSIRAFGQLISAPLVFTAFELFLGDVGIGLIELPVSSAALNTLAEVTLMLTLVC